MCEQLQGPVALHTWPAQARAVLKRTASSLLFLSAMIPFSVGVPCLFGQAWENANFTRITRITRVRPSDKKCDC